VTRLATALGLGAVRARDVMTVADVVREFDPVRLRDHKTVTVVRP
jgi:hypothetical protein